MKTQNLKIKLLSGLIIVMSFGLLSCKKTVVGPQGEAGQDGNANVKTRAFSTNCLWKVDSTSNAYIYRFHIEDLDMSVLQQGMAMLYFGNECGCEWKAMPFTQKKLQYSFSVELSTVEISITSTDGSMPENPGIQKYKLVLIPPAK
ncbi:MAG: hypothetical protein JNL60_00250 [Bacteroidia bacterium]|nr:hypothetical protein [Bacteroidia bacterium]